MIRFSRIEHNVRELFPQLPPYFESQPEVELAYLFGSFGQGTETPLSDIDIAVCLAESSHQETSNSNDSKRVIPREQYFDFRLRMMGDLSHLLKTNEVDLIILNEASLSLRFHAVATREVLFERDPGTRIEFEVQTINRYLDVKPLLRVQQEYFLERIEKGLTFG